jgi:chorismate mutase
MERLNNLREQIDIIDKQMAKLFEERINLVKQIAEVKKEINYPSYDQGRETFILIRNGAYIEDKDTRMMYFEMMRKQFELTKKMQEEILHQSN